MAYQTIRSPKGETLYVLTEKEMTALRAAADAADAAAHATAMADLAAGRTEKLTKAEALALAAAATPLAFWRRKRGLTQAELAEAAGISQSYYAGLETGKRAGSPPIFLRFAAKLGLPMEAIVEDR